MIQNEVSILRRVKHPNIVLLIEEMDVPTELYLVMELVKVRILEKEVNCTRQHTLLYNTTFYFLPPVSSLSFLCIGIMVKSINTKIIPQEFKSQL